MKYSEPGSKMNFIIKKQLETKQILTTLKPRNLLLNASLLRTLLIHSLLMTLRTTIGDKTISTNLFLRLLTAKWCLSWPSSTTLSLSINGPIIHFSCWWWWEGTSLSLTETSSSPTGIDRWSEKSTGFSLEHIWLDKSWKNNFWINTDWMPLAIIMKLSASLDSSLLRTWI